MDISLAALLGDNIYNFGELLLHPIVCPVFYPVIARNFMITSKGCLMNALSLKCACLMHTTDLDEEVFSFSNI